MFTVTDDAREFLHGAAGKLGEDECFRLARGATGQIALVTGQPVSSDLTIEHENRTILAVEQDLADDLKDRKVDLEDAAEGKKGLILV